MHVLVECEGLLVQLLAKPQPKASANSNAEPGNVGLSPPPQWYRLPTVASEFIHRKAPDVDAAEARSCVRVRCLVGRARISMARLAATLPALRSNLALPGVSLAILMEVQVRVLAATQVGGQFNYCELVYTCYWPSLRKLCDLP